ncbi:MAG: putative Ig domain-containing protein, partial [Candidatus Zixiibacteriota bacterium]
MKGLFAGLLLLCATTVFAQPDGRDSVILESKTLQPGAYPGSASDTAAYFYIKVFITNKDTLANFTLPVQIRSLSGGAFTVLGYPRTFAGTMSRLTSTLGNNLTFSPFANNTSPDSALWAAFWDPSDTTTAEPPNAFRKAFWEMKFDSVRSNTYPGMTQIDSAVIFDNRAGFVSTGGNTVRVNFVKGFVFVDACNCAIVNCGSVGGNVLFGRTYMYDFDSDQSGKWSVFIGPGSIDSLTGVYTFSGQCALGSIPVEVRFIPGGGCGGACACSFTINVIDNAPTCAPSQSVVSVSHGQTATNQFDGSDPDAGDGVVFSKLSGPGTVGSNGAWSYQTGCGDVGFSPQFVSARVRDGFGSCQPGPLYNDCQFGLVVTNAAPSVTNCPADVIQADTGSAFSLQLTAADADSADAGNLLFFLVSAPAGLTVSSSGLVQWTPSGSQWGVRSATVQVRD